MSTVQISRPGRWDVPFSEQMSDEDVARLLTMPLFSQDRIDPEIGVDASLGIEYRPLLSDNVIMLFGVSTLVPGSGFRDLFGKTTPFTIENASNVKADPLYAAFFELAMTY